MDMAMTTATNTTNKPMIDIHSHILPGADDGIQVFSEALSLIKRLISEGIQKLVLTPHVLSSAQRMNRMEQKEIFSKLKQAVIDNKLDIDLYLGAEVRYRELLDIDYHDYVIDNTNYILIEFSYHNPTPIDEVIYHLSHIGLRPIVAHIERYDYLKLEDYIKIKSSGGLLQMNASTILGKDHYAKSKKLYKEALHLKLIDFVGSDMHSSLTSKPSLLKAYHHLKKKLDEDYLNLIFFDHANQIFMTK